MEWKTSNYFIEPFIQVGDWDLTSATTFPHIDFLGADTETKLYYNGKLLQEEEAYNLYSEHKAKWCRENIETKAYAYMLSDGKSFALFQNPEDFLTACAMFNCKLVFWYNARFDFALFDYYFETNEWKRTEELLENHHGRKFRFPPKTYQSLNSDYGQRYCLRIWKDYKNRTRNKTTHNFKMIDICNIFGGGLRRNLIDWKITDDTGEEVRKLEMDYANASIENDLQYMINDTKGLCLLAFKIDEVVKQLSGYSLLENDYITAGGLAKKSMLKFMFGKSDKENVYLFKQCFPMTTELDLYLRKLHLYRGGICFPSPYKINKIQHNIYKYDINSMYPTQMRNMTYPYGSGRIVDEIKTGVKSLVYVLKIKNIKGIIKENMIPCWYDTLTNEYKSIINEPEEKLFWLEELEEYKNYYVLRYDVVEILEYDATYFRGAQRYVDNYYEVKKKSKGAIKSGAKLFLNSAYGKLAQRIERVNCHYELSEGGYCHLVKDDIETDEKSMLSVLVGSRITALSRVLLLYYIRTICKNNPKKYFLYCDTDSVHALCSYDDCDDTELGKMKCEGVYKSGKYLAPKTYLLYNYNEGKPEYEVHTKGVNTEVVKKELEKCNTFEEASKLFSSGIKYKCLTSLNVIGGKALIYIDKMLLNPKAELPEIENDENYENYGEY